VAPFDSSFEVVMMTLKGFVQQVRRDRCFAFIRAADGKDYFCHCNAFVDYDGADSDTWRALKFGDAVQFTPTMGERGPRAEDVEFA
jgi:cold shock CspA family protein